MVSAKLNKKYIIKSFSKINLHLNVLQKNKNNLHKIESLVMFCGIHDRIELKKSKTNLHNINFVGKYSNGLQKKNTIKDLLSILDKKKYLKNQKFNIKITKNIPHRSGMGGGSMNAASILKFFIDKNFINLQKTEIMNVAKKIGSDVVLGLNNNIKLLNSRGKIINFKKKFNLYLALVYPNFGCSTSKIYKMVRTYNRPYFKNNRNPKLPELIGLKNDLENVAFVKYRKLFHLKNYIETLPNIYFARMTGSGSTIIGYFKRKKDALYGTKLLRKRYKNYWCIFTKTI